MPQQAEFKKQGGRRCVARRASSIMEGYENQFRQRIAAEVKGEGQEFSGGIQHAVPDGAAERFAHSAEPCYLGRLVGKLLGCMCVCV